MADGLDSALAGEPDHAEIDSISIQHLELELSVDVSVKGEEGVSRAADVDRWLHLHHGVEARERPHSDDDENYKSSAVGKPSK